MLYKYGEAIELSESATHTSLSVLSDPEVKDRFQKLATGLKRIAPKADDFLYFSAVMMHAAEASTVNSDGSPKLLANGERVSAHWVKKGESVRWQCNDASIPPYRNSNGDIFPEEELVKAYKKWIGKPLCIDHKSASVDFVRGVIIDTYYDRVGKRVIALCALDRITFPDLARKVATGVSTCVSMGTAVGRAICSDCGTVARTEHDFCNHMRTKSCYGEINMDLQPIELSIVVNGADPQAKIRHILASANYLNQRAEEAEIELKSLKDTDVTAKNQIVSQIKEGLDALIREFEGSGKSTEVTDTSGEEDLNKAASAESTVENTENLSEEVKITDNLESVTASSDDNDVLRQQFNSLKETIQQKLSKIEENFDKLIKLNMESRDMNMEKKSYHQGTEEPKPGTTQYPAESGNEKARMEHSYMKDVENMGSVDGMKPGDLEKKKLLLRAERREAALIKAKATLSKGAWFQGTEEPTANGKPQYSVDPLNEKVRSEHKHMLGQPPFPGVGKVDGLHPSPSSVSQKDELKRKEMLSRASFSAKFVKAATPDGELDRAASAWQIFVNDKLVINASVKALTGNRVDALYDVIATKTYGTKMLEKVKEIGIEKAASLYTKADGEMAAPPAAAPPAAAPEMPAPGGMPGAESMDEANQGGDGSPADQILGLATDAKNLASDLQEVGELLKDEVPGDAGAAPELAPATASLQKMRFELSSAILYGVTKVASELAEHTDELDLVGGLYQDNSVNDANRAYVESLATDAIADTKASIAEGRELLGSFVNYARGTEAVLKSASQETEMTNVANEGLDEKIDSLLSQMDEQEAMDPEMGDALDADTLPPAGAPVKPAPGPGLAGQVAPGATKADPAAGLAGLETPTPGPVMNGEDDALLSLDASDANSAATLTLKPEDVAKLPPGTEVKMAEFDLSTREGRTAYRMKLAADSGKFNPILNDAHKHLVHKSDAGDLGEVETIQEKHKAMLDVATAPPKVRKEAQELVDLVKAGKLANEDVDALVAHGLDPAVAKFYHELWNDAEGGSEYANELVKEHAKAKLEEEMGAYKVKVARAFGLAYEMVDRGLCSRDASVLSSQVDEIMKYNDDAFDSLKRVVARHAPLSIKKEASRVPQVGLLGNDEPTASAEPDDLFSSLNRAFANRRY